MAPGLQPAAVKPAAAATTTAAAISTPPNPMPATNITSISDQQQPTQ